MIEQAVTNSYAELAIKSDLREFRLGTAGNGTNNANAENVFYIYDATTGGVAGHRFEINSDGDVQARRPRSNTAGQVALSLQPTDSSIHYGFRIDQTNNAFNLDRVDSALNLLNITAAGNATFAGMINVKTDKVQIDQDGTYGGSYGTVGFGGKTNGFNRVFGATGTGDGLFLASATGRGVFIRVNGGSTDNVSFNADGTTTFAGSVDATNYKINGAQGSDGQVLTSTGSGVAWEDASGGVSGSGVNNRLAVWSGTNSIDSDADFYVSGSTLHVNGLQVTADNNFYREYINSATGSESFVAGNGWHRIIEITGGTGRGKCHFLIQTGGGSGTPCRVEAIVNTAWSNANSTLTILHNSYPNFITDIRVVRNSTSGKSFVDIKGTGEDYVEVIILPDGSVSASVVNFTNVNSLPSGDSKQIEKTITNMIMSLATGTGSNTSGETPFQVKYDGSIFTEKVEVDGGQIITPSGVNLALNPNTGIVSVGGVLQASGTGNNTFAGNVSLGDDKNLDFGASTDFRIVHNSTTNVNHISSKLDRQLSLNANNVFITNQANTESMAKFFADAEVKLYYDNVQKFQTTGTGIEVSGHADMDTGNVSGKFAVMSAAVHASYDFYNNGTSYFNGAAIIDDSLTMSGTDAQINFSSFKGVRLKDNTTQLAFELPYFTHNTANLAADILLGNIQINGIIELTLTSGYSHQNAVGEYRFKWIVGFNANGSIWYTPQLIERRITHQGPSQIYVADPAWDSTNSRYHIRVYHKNTSGNQWEGHIKYTSQGAAQNFISNISVSGLLTSTSTSNTHPAGHYLSDQTGDMTLILESKTAGDPTLILNSQAANRNGMINFQDQGVQTAQISYVHNGDTMEFYTGGTGAGHKELTLNETAGAIIRNQATIGHTSNRSGATLHIEGNSNGNWNDGIVLEESSGWNAVVYKRSNAPKMFHGLYSGSDNYIMMSPLYSNSGTAITAPRTDAVMQILPGNDTIENYIPVGFGKNVGVGTTPHANIRFDVLSTATDWTARVKNYTNAGYGLAVDCSGADSSTTYALAVYDAAGTGNFFVRNDGLASLGITPYATAGNAKLQLPSHALAIKNNVSGSNNNWSYIRNTATGSGSNIEFTTGVGIALTLNHNKSAVFTGDVTVNTGLYPDANYGAELGTSNLRWSVIRGKYLDLQQSSASDPVLRLTDEGVASYDVVFPNTSTYQLQTSTTSNKTFKLHNAGSGTFSMDIEGDLTVGGSFQHPVNLIVNSLTAHNIRTKGTSANEEFPIGHWNEGEEVFSIDPTWSETQLQNYFGSSNVEWYEDSTAPSGWAIKITGGVNVGVDYGSGFPHIAIEEDAIYYMECHIRGFASDSVVGHYMGSIDVEHDFSSPPTGSGNPGSYGYWVMGNTSSNGTSWSKRTGIIRGFSDTATGAFETAAKYWTPQALFNYSHGSGTRACVISGWRVVKISKQRMLTDGSIANPSLTFAEDQNTGLFRPASDQLGFSVGGSRKMYMSATKTFFQNQANGVEINNGITLVNGALSISGDTSNAATLTESSAGILTIATVDDLVLDSGSDLTLDAGGNDIRLKVNGVEYAKFKNDSGDLSLYSSIQDKDIYFRGNDGGTTVDALRFDISDQGWAHFNTGIAVGNASATSTFAGALAINGASSNSNTAKLDVKLAQTNGTLGAANTVHFGDQAHSNGQIMGITLGYKEHANVSYRKLAMVAEGRGDSAARQNLHLLVNNVFDSSSASLAHRVLSIDGFTQETCLKSVLALSDGSYGKGYRKVHLGIFAGPPSTTTESRSWRLGRLYYNAHWGHYGTMKIQVRTKYPYNGYLEYDVIQASDGGYAVLTNLAGAGMPQQAQVYLGQQTDTGVDYGGHNIYYKDIVLQLDTYIQARVTIDVYAEYFEFDKTSVTTSQYYYSTLFRNSTNQAQATLSDQAELTQNIFLPGHNSSTSANSSHVLRSASHLRLNTGKGLYFDGNTHSHTYIVEEGDNNMKFYVGGTEHMGVGGGDVFIRTPMRVDSYIYHIGDTSTNIRYENSQITIQTAGGSHIQINNDENIYFRTNGTNRFKMDTSGNFIATADIIAYGSVSDVSYKENIKPITGALNLVDKLQGVTFDWKEDTDTNKMVGIKEDIGFIAQDVEKVLPTLVRENENGKLSIRDKGIVPVLVEAIKELKAEIEELKKQIK